jgi:hypothetical protein
MYIYGSRESIERELYASAAEGIEEETIDCTHARKTHSSRTLDSLVLHGGEHTRRVHGSCVRAYKNKSYEKNVATASTYKNVAPRLRWAKTVHVVIIR